MDRFLDEQESPATLDRINLPAIAAADCDQAMSGFLPDDKSGLPVDADGKPVVVDEDVKPRLSNGESLTVATLDEVAVSSALSATEPVTDSVVAHSVTDTDLRREDATAEVTWHSPVLRPSLCLSADDTINGKEEKMATEQVNTADDVSTAAVAERTREKSDSEANEDISERADTTDLSSSAAVHDQLLVDNDNSVSDVRDSEVLVDAPAATASVSPAADLPSTAVLQEPHSCVSATDDDDEVGRDDMEQSPTAVDSAGSHAASQCHADVSPVIDADEFSSRPLSDETLQRPASCTRDLDTDRQSPTSTLLPQSSSGQEVPASLVTATPHLLSTCSDVSPVAMLEWDDRSSPVAGRDTEMITVSEPPPANTSADTDSLAASQDVPLADQAVENRPYSVDAESTASCVNDADSSVVELDCRDDNDNDNRHPAENELASSHENLFTQSCSLSNNVSASVAGCDVSGHASSVTDSVTPDVVALYDKLPDRPHSLDEDAQSDSRPLLTLSSEVECTSPAS